MSVQYSLYSDLEHYRNSPPAPVLVKEVSFDGKVRLKANSDSSPPVSRKKKPPKLATCNKFIISEEFVSYKRFQLNMQKSMFYIVSLC